MQRLNPAYLLLLLLISACSPQPPPDSNTEGLFGGLTAESGSINSLLQVQEGETLRFPEDHKAHPDYAIEWWYFTANLVDTQDPTKHYSLQYTLFRFNDGNRVPNAWSDGQILMAHASLHSAEQHWFSERFARNTADQDTDNVVSGVAQNPLTLRLEDWVWRAEGNTLLPATLELQWETASISASLDATGPLVLHGDNGYSRKSASGSHASFYYSQPFIQVTGQATMNGQVVGLTGQGWFDHEWTSQLLDNNTKGWDWFSIHLDDGRKLMAFRMRLRDQPDHITGTLIDIDGVAQTLSPREISLKPTVQNDDFPSHWRIDIPSADIALETKPKKSDQWNRGRFEYYEGAIELSGTHSGIGFMELTGY